MASPLLHTAVQLRPKRKNSVYSENKILKLEGLIRIKFKSENCSHGLFAVDYSAQTVLDAMSTSGIT